MLIGIDASRANRSHKSGTEWYSYYTIRALAEADSHNQYILYTDSPLRGGLVDLRPEGEHADAESMVKPSGFQKIRSPHNNFKAKVLRWPWKFFWTQGRLSLEMIFHRPDILFVPAHALPIIHPKNSVVTIHDIGFRSDPHLYEKARVGADSRRRHSLLNAIVKIVTLGKYGANTFDYLEWSTRFSLKKARRIVAISNFTKQELMKAYQASQDKVTVIYNGYAKEIYHPLPDSSESQEIIHRYGIKPPYFFYIGRLDKKKNITTLIEGFARFKQRQGSNFKHHLCLVGDASFGFDEVKYTIDQYNLSNDIIMTGWVKEEDVPHIFARADAFVFPSYYEGFGIPLLQAMATETPIAASRAASIPEVVGEAALLFDPKNSEEIALCLDQIATDHSVRDSLVQAGRKRIKDFSWEQSVRDLISLFSTLLKQKRP